MAFKLRVSGSQLYHHIYAMGNDRHPIFKKNFHYYRYLKLLKEYAEFFRIEVIAYALMKWHVHLFIHDLNDTVSDFIMNLHGDYARFYNRTTSRVGHVFGERFNNRIVQPNNYGLWLSRYIHRQPVEAGLVKDPTEYAWTSYRVYLALEKNEFLKPAIILKQFGDGAEAYANYKNFVLDDDDGPIDWQTAKQQIIGDDDFIKKLANDHDVELDDEVPEHNLEEIVKKTLGLDMNLLLRPKGKKARLLRHKVIAVLGFEYKFTKSEIARAFNMSVPAVSKVLNKQNLKS
jgi:putative transposase